MPFTKDEGVQSLYKNWLNTRVKSVHRTPYSQVKIRQDVKHRSSALPTASSGARLDHYSAPSFCFWCPPENVWVRGVSFGCVTWFLLYSTNLWISVLDYRHRRGGPLAKWAGVQAGCTGIHALAEGWQTVKGTEEENWAGSKQIFLYLTEGQFACSLASA